ncbi:hypothetical protein HJFPF1_13344 [Paramyrothecium foliicola]|nr:hypothetical protein HJFPF1_13344 [Paramyrothecium foliicola]
MASVVQSSAPSKDINSFITEFYRLSDTPAENEPWISAFTSDAYVQIGPQKATGSEDAYGSIEIRKLRGWIWDVLAESKHNVSKILESTDETSPEIALFGDATFLTKDQATFKATWAGHVELKKEGEELKISSYRVWSQNE